MALDAPCASSRPDAVSPGSLAGVEVWLFDLDNTLYPASCDLFPLIERRMGAFIADTLGLTPDEARRRQKRFFREYGTTMRGLMLEHDVDPLAFLEYVHAIDLSALTPRPGLDLALGRLGGRKLVFTNASRRHALAVLARLGISAHFEAIHDIAAADFLPKPDPRAYVQLVRRYGIDPLRACMVEDIARNLVPAAALGMTTAWVRSAPAWSQPTQEEAGIIHHVVEDLEAWLAAVSGA